MDLSTLHSKANGVPFTEEEIAFIKKKIPKGKFVAKYAIYKPKSSLGLYVGFFIDSMPYVSRRSGIENVWDFICERPLTNIEYQEQIANFGSHNRRFTLWQYKNVEYLIEEDKKYNVETPQKFIDECKRRGFSGNRQTLLEFETYDTF